MAAVGKFEKLAEQKVAAAATAALAGVVAKPPRKMAPRMRVKGSPTHVRSVPLRLTPAQRSLADIRLTVGVRLYNAVLGELMKRTRLAHADPRFEAAKKLPPGPAKTKAFQVVNAAHGFTGFYALSLGSSFRKSYLGNHILTQEAQQLAKRAFGAVQRWNFGQGGKPRFKTSRDGLRSLACTDKLGSLHPKILDGKAVGLFWGNKTVLGFATPSQAAGRRGREQRAEWAQVEELMVAGKVLSTAIVKTVVRGRTTYRANLTCDGPRPQRHPVGTGVVSFDLGPSVNAVVKADLTPDGSLKVASAQIVPMAPLLADTAKQLRRLQRCTDRQHRAGSPECFQTNGKHITGKCLWIKRSARSRATKVATAELHRVRAAYRKTSHGQQLNDLLAHGSTIHAEKLNYVAWQKRWGRSVRDRAPGALVEMGRSKAESAGGGLFEYSTYTTRLSQACLCGAIKKKELSQRIHRCACGITAQRDLFSAFLGLFVTRIAHPDRPDAYLDVLDLDSANLAWSASPEIEWLPKKSTSTTAVPKRRGQVRPSGRSMARITKRRKSGSDRAARQTPTHPCLRP